MTQKQPERCKWVSSSPLYRAYHDNEWGVPVYDDRLLFEFLILEGMQAGLSWITVLNKREHYRKRFDNFEPAKMARYSAAKQQSFLKDAGLIRNRLKIAACCTNAKAYSKITTKPGDFSTFLWQFVEGKPIQHHFRSLSQVPTQIKASQDMSKTLKKAGFKFVGPTICYALMQAVGMVNDHTTDCFRYKDLA